jgi:tetratricopeptide (TPR) repeat protein
MLYQTLTGRLPFLGTFDDVLEAKRHGPPQIPSELIPAELADLAELCQQVLAPDPDHRPPSEAILHRLGCESAEEVTAATRPSDTAERVFVGRKAELGQLNQAFADVQAGRPVNVYVEGPSGIGKTALVTRFLEQYESREDVLVFPGRCYERESVPYKALDGVVDALVFHLRAMPEAQLQSLLPDQLGCLVRVFPALKQLRLVGDRARLETVPAERREVRRRAVHALRELLSRLAALQPTILLVDDLQWGDTDSALVLNELFDSPESPRCLFIGCYRGEDRRGSPCLQTLLEASFGPEAGTNRRQVTLQPLSVEESRLLAAAFVEPDTGGARTREADVSRESRGNPYFLIELARESAQDVAGAGESGRMRPVDLEGMLFKRVGRLPEAARELLSVIAVAGHPLPMEAACRAIQSTPDPRTTALLRSEHLIRIASGGQPDEVETYHDRIRETISTRLSSETRRGYHARLAVTLEASPEADPEILCVHFEAAGDTEKAAGYGLLAADRAADALAFDRAAQLYRFVLGLRAFDAAEEPDLQKKLADALANAGRGAEAAEHYLTAADQVTGIETVELKRLAADQLLRTGRYQEGRRVLADAASAVGLKLPKSPRHAIRMILVDSLRLWLRGRRFRERDEAEIPREELVRVDTCWSCWFTLSMTVGFTGMGLYPKGKLLARSVGEPGRMARTVALDADMRTLFAGQHTAGSARLFKMAEALAIPHKNPYWIGFVKLTRGEAESFLGHWRRAIPICEEAEAVLRQDCTGVHFEISIVALDSITSLFFLGEIKELSRRIPGIVREAAQRDDLFAGVAPRTYFGNMVWLAADRVEEARRQAQRALAGWPPEPFLLQHVFELIGSASIDLYAGEGLNAWDRIAQAWPEFKRAGHLRHPLLRTVVLHARAGAALASLGRGLKDRMLIRSAERDVKRLPRKRRPWSWPLACLVRAGIASARGKKEQAVEYLETAIREFDAWEMALYSAAAKRRLGELIGGQRGEKLIAAGTEFMTQQGIVRPDRMTRMLAPGFD